MTRGGLRLSAIAVAIIAAAAVVAVSGTLVDGNRHQPAGQAPQHRGSANLVPDSGAYLGAYVKPAVHTPQAQIEAVRSFERRLGHPVGLVHVFHPWRTRFPSAADRHFVNSGKALLLTWGGTPNMKRIAAGGYDTLIRSRAEGVKRLGRPILLEFRHEMDRPNLRWEIPSPGVYIAAWNHIRKVFASVGARNVSWVWCPTAQGFTVGRAQAFYPGDNEVDWVCTDAYSASPSEPLSVTVGHFLTWASQHDKPVLIGEFGVGGDPARWAAWLTAAGRMAKQNPQIKGLAYYNADGRNYSGDSFAYSINRNPSALSAFAALLDEPYFRPAKPGTRTRR